MDPVARHVVVEGRVQGVSYRAATVDEAHRYGVTGWVANRADGAVEAWFEGPVDAVAAMVTWCRSGPPQARVERVSATSVLPTGVPGFEIRARP